MKNKLQTTMIRRPFVSRNRNLEIIQKLFPVPSATFPPPEPLRKRGLWGPIKIMAVFHFLGRVNQDFQIA